MSTRQKCKYATSVLYLSGFLTGVALYYHYKTFGIITAAIAAASCAVCMGLTQRDDYFDE